MTTDAPTFEARFEALRQRANRERHRFHETDDPLYQRLANDTMAELMKMGQECLRAERLAK